MAVQQPAAVLHGQEIGPCDGYQNNRYKTIELITSVDQRRVPEKAIDGNGLHIAIGTKLDEMKHFWTK